MPRSRAAATWLPLAMLLSAASSVAAAPPQRIMSVNLCTDQLLLALVPPERIVSVSSLSRDCEISMHCADAAGMTINHGSAEEVIAGQPDLVVAGLYTARPAVMAARQGGVPVLELNPGSSFDEVREQIRRFAAAVGETDRGEALVQKFDRRLASVPSPATLRPLAAVYQTNGYTVGRHSLIDAALTAAGFDNLAARLDIDHYPFVPMEALVAYQPDVLVLDTPNLRYPSLGDEMLHHPVLAKAFRNTRHARLEHRQWICPGPAVADAVAELARVRVELQRQARP